MLEGKAAHPLHVLLVEDDADDARLLTQAFHEVRDDMAIERVKSGKELHTWLADQSRDPKAPAPAMVVLDLHLPDSHGVDLLSELRAHPGTRELPVVVLTGSESDRDIDAAWKADATTYYVKPSDYDEYLRLARDMQTFWMESAQAEGGSG